MKKRMSMTALGMLMAQPAMAGVNCPPASSTTPVTCNVTADQGGIYEQVTIDFLNDTDGLHPGNSGGDYTVINSAALSGTHSPYMPIMVRLRGENGTVPYAGGGDDGFDGGRGGTIHITNHSGALLSASNGQASGTLGPAPGIWDDIGFTSGIYGASVGGHGGEASDGMDGGDGGNGGAGSNVSIDNSGDIRTWGYLNLGSAGIYGASIGGDGGRQHSSLIGFGNQNGGDGGNGGTISISNQGKVDLDISNVKGYAWGLAAESIGGNGGQDGGDGGDVSQNAASIIQNGGSVTITTKGPALPQGVRGISMLHQGGKGYTSNDGSDPGGAGGDFGQMRIVNSGTITIIGDAAPEPTGQSSMSGGIVMIGRGGDGGDGSTDEVFSGTPAGNGGSTPSSQSNVLINVQLDKGSSIITQGNYLPGVNLSVWGGTGGLGRNDSDGGDGGRGGAATVRMRDGTLVSTDGAKSHGIAARSDGGSGGGHKDSGGVIDFSSNKGGDGGDGGAVSVLTGDASSGEAGGAIQTQGDNSIGILAQSMGGLGGNTGYSFDWIYQTGNDGGNGGAAGLVTVDSRSAVTTHGASSHGIVGQSISGGGGIGGTGAGIKGVGGDGGTARAGGEVLLKQSGDMLQTHGAGAYGMLSQSIGGGGGDGGGANGVVAIGGSGSGGGNGGKSTIEVNSHGVQTDGDHAHGLIAQSIGGGGGSGGAASAYDGGVGFSVAIALGGSGSTGGAGGAATVNVSNATITTNARGEADGDANAIVVQSIGGGGGAGGDSMAHAFTLAVPGLETPVGIAASYALGGTAGGGGSGGSATSTLSNASILTHGDNSQGVVVQSIGGGGGIGGSASAASTLISGTGESLGSTVSSALGGSGGDGGNGGTATHTQQGSHISTSGRYANAILLQSVGGGGGSGGIGSAASNAFNTDTTLTFTTALGGSGGNGGNGGTVNLTIDAGSSVTTKGDGARGALVQSIGGGGGVSQGGQAGFDFSGSSPAPEGEDPVSINVGASVSIGRSGAGGGNGGTVHLSHMGVITTHGADADGLLMQSVGGGGGVGGAVGGDSGGDDDSGGLTSLFDDSSVEYHLDAYLGGSGGSGGSGGDIGSSGEAIDLGGHISTYGDYADAVVMQSIGGGGGAGGVSSASSSISTSQLTLAAGGRGGFGGNGGNITAFFDDNHENRFNTSGYGAMGVVLQSIGGGGGMAASGAPLAQGKLSVGGRGNNGGSGGEIVVTPTSWANITTQGDSAHGLVLQSIGGGGGIAMAGSTSTARNGGGHQLDLQAGSNASAGSGGGLDAHGGDITVSTGFSLNTYGDRALGVVAQSIGGGGGIVSAGAADGLGSITLGSADTGAETAYGGTVNLDLSGALTTRGDGAHGIVAQSIGGGGGIVGDTAQVIQAGNGSAYAPSGSYASDKSGGDVSVAFDGYLSTSGSNAHGIVAQSIGGGGGLVGGPSGGFAGSVSTKGISGNVTVDQSGTLLASGANSVGILAQSDAATRGAVVVNINGDVQGGSEDGSGVWMSSGASGSNQLNIREGASLSALSNVAVRYDGRSADDDTQINNDGTLKGDVICSDADGAAGCTLNNQKEGIATGAEVYKAAVNNNGSIVVNQPGKLGILHIDGDFSQSADGVLSNVNVDFANRVSSYVSIWAKAELDGSVEITPISLMPGRELMILGAHEVHGTLTAIDSPVVEYALRNTNDAVLVRAASAEFDAPAMDLKSNHQQVARHLQQIWNQGGNTELAPLFAHLDMASRQGADGYRQSISQLSPGVTLAPAAQAAANLAQFTNTMMSCPGFGGVNALTQERDCFWGQVSGRTSTQNASGDMPGFHYSTVSYQFGGQKEVSPGWFVGGSVAYENSHLRGSESRVSGKGDSAYIGAVVKRQQGDWTFSAAVGGGYGSYHMNRSIGIAGYQDTLSSSPDVYGFNARLRAARTFAYDNFYVKPYVDLDASYTRMPGHTESGANPLALTVDGSSQFTLGVSPMVEIGGRAELGNGAILRPFMYAGVSFLSQDDWKASARLRGAPGARSFDTSLPIDDVVGRVGAGLEITKTGGVEFRLQYDGMFSKNVRSHSGTLKVMMPF